ncbi:MAG: TetR/AcrR family transcriptional regulator [Hamadaea sp.]|uniref:TetR/AcrR family transcriptional regulator n=1 Tax=Hamadaea sp. TaxID=2024425 RepID=UPI0017E8A4A9|nr:TetR family transcriptional regulator [Hamadaea sp.]NUR74296.1 TetR/AcrR family transcriptional regulator [Hamadaea sp.]NUT24194.1 TetR/AcrR family transcriptional regulator [Hamadaea sp.]
MAEMSLRERKKKETGVRLWVAAVKLFAERGFDAVSTAEIAAAADVSKMTLFNYFPTKEDLVLMPMEDHLDEPARVVRARADGQTPVAALKAQFLTALAGRDPATGLNDSDSFVQIQRLIRNTPALLTRALRYELTRVDTLAEALAEPGPVTPLDRVRGRQIMGVIGGLVEHNVGRVLAGEKADDVYPDAVALAESGFDLLR